MSGLYSGHRDRRATYIGIYREHTLLIVHIHMCLFLYMCAYFTTCMLNFIHACLFYAHVLIFIHVCLFLYTHAFFNTHMLICIHACLFLYTRANLIIGLRNGMIFLMVAGEILHLLHSESFLIIISSIYVLVGSRRCYV